MVNVPCGGIRRLDQGAWQYEAFLEDQVNVVLSPMLIFVLSALKVMSSSGDVVSTMDAVFDWPSLLMHLTEKLLLPTPRAPVCACPNWVDICLTHEGVHDTAVGAAQLMVTISPLANMLEDDGVSVMTGGAA